MTAATLNIVDKYFSMFESLSDEAQTLLANRILKSLKKKTEAKEDDDYSFLNKFSGAWDDGTTVEEQVKMIRDSRTSGLTRKIDEF